MLKFSVKTDISKMLRKFDLVEKQAKYATAVGLTKTAQGVKQDLRLEMARLFEAPSGFTLNSIYVDRATKQKLTAWVGIKQGAINWLRPEVYGGPRKAALEKSLRPLGLPPSGMWAVPGIGAKLTAGKHISMSWVRKLVAALSLQGPVNPNKRVRKSTQKYFVVTQKQGNLEPGIYGRTGTKTLPLILFVRQPHYKKQFNFFEVAQRSAKDRVGAAMRESIRNALASAR